ncbi:hypothetical protein ACXWQ9_09330, partial [Streptococcus pyogenes]
FYVLTIVIVQAGVKQGIERWSTRLMPALFVLFAAMFVYIMTLPGATNIAGNTTSPAITATAVSTKVTLSAIFGRFSLWLRYEP